MQQLHEKINILFLFFSRMFVRKKRRHHVKTCIVFVSLIDERLVNHQKLPAYKTHFGMSAAKSLNHTSRQWSLGDNRHNSGIGGIIHEFMGTPNWTKYTVRIRHYTGGKFLLENFLWKLFSRNFSSVHKLSENIWFVICHTVEKRCHACA